MPGLESQRVHPPAVGSWANHLSSLGLSFLTCQRRIRIIHKRMERSDTCQVPGTQEMLGKHELGALGGRVLAKDKNSGTWCKGGEGT